MSTNSAEYMKKWHEAHPGYKQEHAKKWRENHQDYWRDYPIKWEDHPESRWTKRHIEYRVVLCSVQFAQIYKDSRGIFERKHG